MSLADLGPVGWPSPLVDPDRTIDPYRGATPAGGSLFAATFASGASVTFNASSPLEGVLRLSSEGARTESPMLVAPAGAPARVAAEGGDLLIDGDGIAARWGADGALALAGGAFARAGDATHVRAGRLLDATGEPAGWLESVALVPGAGVYGGGESSQGPDLRGRVRRVFNSETHGMAGLDWTYLNVPFFWSDAGWGLFAHTGGPVVADLGATHAEAAAVAVEDAALDLFLITGPSPDAILRRYLALTGMPGAFPDWALGVWSSRCSYLSEEELQETVRGYRAANCPVDVVHVDGWVAGNVIRDLACNWTVDRDRFPEGWGDRLLADGVRLSLWHNPYVVDGSEREIELRDLGLLVVDDDGKPVPTPDKTDRHLVDFTNPAAVAWWQDRVRETVASEHNAAFKPDFGEELPLDARMADGRTGREVRNEYALRYQAATHEALREALGEDAVALFCRSGTAGAQRYPCHWVGDTPSTWEGLVTALRSCLSLSLSGFAFVSSDIGGFWTGGSHGWVAEAFEVMDNRAVPADVDGELFARWAQWGALSPVMRFHGTGRREPWAYPGAWGRAAVEACRLRERLRPYLERCAADAVETGTPLMRPLVLALPGAAVPRGADLQYLLGPDVLVAPLLAPGGTARVWIPEGSWQPLMGLEPVEGPGWVDVTCSPTQFPAWYRGEAVL